MPLRVLYFDLRLCQKLCASSFLVMYLKLFKRKVISSRAECTYHISPETPISWPRELESHPSILLNVPSEASPALLWFSCCWLSNLTLGHFISGHSAVKSGYSWGMRPRYGLGRFHLMTGCYVCFTEVRWFYDKKGLYLRIKWNVHGQRYTLVFFCKLQCHSQSSNPHLSSPSPSLSFVNCWLKILELLRDLGRG